MPPNAAFSVFSQNYFSEGCQSVVFEKVQAILSSQFDVEEDSITLTTNIRDDLGADSLDAVDMLMSLEDEFDLEIPDEAGDKIRTVGDLVTYIEERL